MPNKIIELNAVANSFVLKQLSGIDIFQLDLGNNLTGPVQPNKPIKIKITDIFAKKYMNDYNRLVYKYGNIGTIKFYNDLQLLNNEIYFFQDDKIYEIQVDSSELKNNPKLFLSKIVKNICEEETISEGNTKITEESRWYTTNPDEDTPDIKLPYDIYIQQLVARRRKLDGFTD